MINEQELTPDLQLQRLEFERAKLFVEFAKFGFSGTLTAAIGGMILILVIAVLDAFTELTLSSWAYIGLALLLLAGAALFGFLSLWELPRLAARFMKLQFTVEPGKRRDNSDR